MGWWNPGKLDAICPVSCPRKHVHKGKLKEKRARKQSNPFLSRGAQPT